MATGKLDNRCAQCWCFKQGRCTGCYDEGPEGVSGSGDFIETFSFSDGCDNSRSPGDAECAKHLVTVDDGSICLNYNGQCSIHALDAFTKEEMAQMMYHLREKPWYSIFLESVFVHRVFELKGWTPDIVLDVTRL